MKFNKAAVNKDVLNLEENISFKDVRKPLLGLDNINVKATIFVDKNLVNVTFNIKGVAKVECAYTLEPVDYPLDFSEVIDISDDENNMETYFVKGNQIDLDPIILDLILGEIPTRVVKKGATIKQEGEGYRVISEDDLKKEHEDEYNPAFDKLKDLDL